MNIANLLELCISTDERTRHGAYVMIEKLSSEEMFVFIEQISKSRGIGSGIKKAICRWYNSMPLDVLLTSVRTYPKEHLKLIRIAHPKASSYERNRILRSIVR